MRTARPHRGHAASCCASSRWPRRAGIGWLDALRRSRACAAGPRITGRAAAATGSPASDAQPLLRVLAAWVPAGLACGAALSR